MSHKRRFGRKEKREKHDYQVNEDAALGQSQPGAEPSIQPAEKNLLKKAAQGVSKGVGDDKHQGEDENKTHHGEMVEIGHMRLEKRRRLVLQATAQKYAPHDAGERGNLPQESPENSLHHEKNHGAEDKDVQDVHSCMFIRGDQSPSRPQNSVDEWKRMWHE